MLKRILCISSLLAALAATAAVPRVSNVKMTPYGKCSISYTLSEAPGIVTFDILTNGVSIGVQNLTNAFGDVNTVVQPGERKILWNAKDVWPDHKFRTPCVKARVTVWPTNAPPDWLAVDLTKDDCPVTYYASEDALPWGKVWTNAKYKGDVLLMRKVSASHVLSFMGSPETEANRTTDGRETRRMCALTNDYFLGIYPLTFRQFYLLNQGPTTTETRMNPVITIAYNQLRYATANAVNGLPIDFPSKTTRTQVGGSSYLRSWRNKTGLELDLPTSAQWEFACRAGTDTPLYWGDGTMSNLGAICHTGSGSNYNVGLFGGNAWQFYDMVGNCYEWCLDYYESGITGDAVTDPLGPTAEASVQRKVRGYHAQDVHKRSAFFSAGVHTRQDGTFGCRLCITLP